MYAFDYQRPTSRDAAKAAAAGADARYLAGGQSLIQAMRLRLSQSERLVDLGAIADLKAIKADGNGVTIGAMATHASVAANADVKRIAPAIAELAGGIGDPMVRNMGTIGGSIANADPAACYPAGVLGVQRDDPHRPAHDRRRRLLHRPVRDRAAARRADHRRHLPGGAEGGLRQVQAAGVALRADRRVRRADGGRRARRVTGAKGHVFRATEIENALAEELHARCGEGGEDADHRHQRRPARLGRVPRRDDQRDRLARGRGGARTLSVSGLRPAPARERRGSMAADCMTSSLPPPCRSPSTRRRRRCSPPRTTSPTGVWRRRCSWR